MIRPFNGEFLVSPVPVHLGLNWCSHNCFYCFANLNQPNRRADFSMIGRTVKTVLSGDKSSKNLAARLLMEGHPILASNDSDPFAKSNAQQIAPLLDVLWENGIRVVFQTRGGDGAMAAIEKSPKTMLYVSFTTDMEDVRKGAEPGTPHFEERKALVEAAKAHGHHVVIGLNPYVPEWWADFGGFVDWMIKTGVRHVWAGQMHLNRFQVSEIRGRQAAQFSGLIAEAAKKRRDGAAYEAALDWLDEAGVNVFSGATSKRGGFWRDYFDLGFPFFPTMDWFFSSLEKNFGQRVAFDFSFFLQEMNPHPDFEMSEMKDYLCGFGRSVRNTGQQAKARTYEEVLMWFWQIDKFPTPLRRDFIFLAEDDDQTLFADEFGRLILVYDPTISDPDIGRLAVKEGDILTAIKGD